MTHEDLDAYVDAVLDLGHQVPEFGKPLTDSHWRDEWDDIGGSG